MGSASIKYLFAVVAVGLLATVVYAQRHQGDPVEKKELQLTSQTGHDAHATGKTNHLVGETSPYLLQHIHNPVDWYPWGDEALAKARREDKPIFLSIGYSACHWCHVMAHESFEDDEVAALLNKDFICIKVDREERPDIDDIYMTAVQMLTGSGGWPMSVFLTPDLKPFYGGTYFPKNDKYGRPGFISVVQHLAKAWHEKRDEVLKSSLSIAESIEQHSAVQGKSAKLDISLVAKASASLLTKFDKIDGGFGGAPKFPNSNAIGLLLRHGAKTGDKALLQAATFTLDKMAHGGMYDQVGGGFHRYSVDGQWLVPHFEKMLYDNGQLAAVYLQAYQLTAKHLYKRIVREIFTYQMREMTAPGGAFYSAEDADSEGEEGKYYIWRADELRKVLRKKDYQYFSAYYNIKDKGNFSSHESYHAALNIAHMPRDPSSVAASLGIKAPELMKVIVAAKKTLFEVRAKRVHPGLDDKVLTSWNALMISAMARGYQVLGDQQYLDAARASANYILNNMQRDGELLRTSRKGKAHLSAYLNDYAFLIVALIDLYESDFDDKWLNQAEELTATMIRLLWDDKQGGFYFSKKNVRLITRMKPTYDGAEPSGNAVAAEALFRLGNILSDESLLARARQTIEINHDGMMQSPRGFLKMINVMDDYYWQGPSEVVVAGDIKAPETQALLKAVRQNFYPAKVVLAGQGPKTESLPLFKGRKAADGKPKVYVCRNHTCQNPVQKVDKVLAALRIQKKLIK